MKKIAAITMSRNDEVFLNRWIAYYGRELGEKNLYIYLDGEDQKIPSKAGNANITKMPHKELSRLRGDKHRIKLLSDLAKKLFADGYEIVIGTDTDEFLVVDPNTGKSLAEYLSDSNIKTTLSGLGLDVGQHLNKEYELDFDKPFLTQREYALLSTRFTKTSVIAKPLRWGSGFHSIKGTNFHIDKNLYLLHFGSVDYNRIATKVGARAKSWKKHIMRRAENIFLITKKHARGEKAFKFARFIQTTFRPIYAIFKPSMLGMKLVVKIPERFKKTGI